ncbi:MAG: CCA tRNA nucleotidyltransferase [Gemmatimonadales bacterium]
MSRKLSPPPAVLKIARTLEKAGYETWCVGGAVRDALLGHAHLDWDLATAARPERIRNLFPRTVPVGIKFGTIGVLDEHGVLHEVTTFRRDVKTDGRHAEVEFGATLDEDLARRDYTINAIAYSPSRKEISDPFEGRVDLEKGIVRAVGDPEERMREDRLRALRAMRFAARFGFEIDPATWQAIVHSAAHLGRLSAERVKQEIEKTMEQVAQPSRAFQMWEDSGAFGTLIPHLANATAVDLATIDKLSQPGLPTRPGRRMMRMIALFAAAPPGTVLTTLRDLRFSNADAAWVSSIVTRWNAMAAEMRFAMVSPDPPSDAVLRRWAALAGRTQFASVLRLGGARWAADRDAGIDAPSASRVSSVYRRAIRIAYRDPIEVGDLAVNGRDLEKAGLTGPAVGQTLRTLLESVINDPASNSREMLLKSVEQMRLTLDDQS